MRRPFIAVVVVLIVILSVGIARMREKSAPSPASPSAQSAVQRGQSKEGRDVGAMIVRDHRGMQQTGRDLAKKLGVTPTPPPEGPFSLKHKAAMKMLREVKTAEFDQAFLKHEASYHAEVIPLVSETLLPAIVNAELKALVVKVSPVFEAHRAGADALSRRLGK